MSPHEPPHLLLLALWLVVGLTGPARAATWTPFSTSEDLLSGWREAGRYPGAVCVAGGLWMPEPQPEPGRRPKWSSLAADPNLVEAILWSQSGGADRWWVVDRPEVALVRITLLMRVPDDPAGALREGLYADWVETPWRETYGWSWRMEHSLIGPAHLRVRAWVEPHRVDAVLAAVDQLKARVEQSEPETRASLVSRGAQLLAIDQALGRAFAPPAGTPNANPTLGTPSLQVVIQGDLREIPVGLWADPRWPDWRPDGARVLERAKGLGTAHCPG